MYTLLRPHSLAVGQIPIVPLSDNNIPNQAFHQHNKRAWRTTWRNRFFYHVYHGYHERRVYIFSEGGKGLCLKGTDLAFNVRTEVL